MLNAEEIKRKEVCNSTFCGQKHENYAVLESKSFLDALVIGDYAVDLHGCKRDDDLESNDVCSWML